MFCSEFNPHIPEKYIAETVYLA